MVILDNREVRQGWDALKNAVTGMFTKHGVEILVAKRWDERRLAYPINRQQRATYLVVYFNGEADAVAHIRRELELNESTMRHVVLACDKVPEDAFEPEDEFDETQVQVEEISIETPHVAAAEEEAPAEGEKATGEDATGEKAEAAADTDAAAEEVVAEVASPDVANPGVASPEVAESSESEKTES